MNRTLAFAALALAFSPAASAQLQTPVYPSWAVLVVPSEVAKAQTMAEPSAALAECFKAHKDALFKKPENVTPLVADHLGADSVRRDCAMAAEVDQMIKAWNRSSPSNGYSPLANFIGNQNKALAARPEMDKCQARKFIHASAEVFNGIVANMVPPTIYSWVKPVATAPCMAAAG